MTNATQGSRKAQLGHWLQEALFTRQADAYFNPLIQAFAPSYGLSSKYQQARVIDIQHTHNNALILKIQPPKGWQGFVPGQYVACEFEINGIRKKRNYSICSSQSAFAKTGQIEISIHRVEGGSVSNFVLNELRLNTLFAMSEAMGEFGVELNQSTNKKPVLMLAAGSGITPIASLLRSVQQGGRNTQLIYSCSKSSEHLFQDEFLSLEKSQSNLHVLLHSTQEKESDKRVNAKLIQSLCADIAERDIFICGSNAYTQNMIDCLKSLGVSDSAIHTESFDSAVKFLSIDTQGGFITFSRSNKNVSVKNEDSILEHAELLGLNPKSGCRMGVCHSCTCTKKSGLVRNMLTGDVSEADEEEIRICISQPIGEVNIDL